MITPPKTDLFVDVLQHIQVFHSGPRDSLDLSKNTGTHLTQDAYCLTIPFAVRMPHWNRIIMYTLRNACETIECWPRFLARMRSSTICFRNEACRVAIQVYIQTLGQNGTDCNASVFHSCFREVALRDRVRGCVPISASWHHLLSKAFWELSATRSLRVWMVRGKTSSYGCSSRQLLRSCSRSNVSDKGAVHAVAIEADLLRGEKVAYDNKCMRVNGCFG